MAEVEFSIKIRGYDQKEVDAYISKLHTEYAEICAHLQGKITKMEDSLGDQEDIAKAMIRAESMMRRMEEEEKIKAERLISEAQITADHIVGDARSNANQILAVAQNKADETIKAAENKANSITIMAEVQAERVKGQIYQSRVEIQEKMQQIFNISSLFLKEMERESKGEDAANEYKDAGNTIEWYTNENGTENRTENA